jgi:glycerol-3-phosphate acyltransferase PlsX
MKLAKEKMANLKIERLSIRPRPLGIHSLRRAKLKIAVDAMGGDYAPQEIVKGALAGAREHNVELILVGQPQAIEAELAGAETREVVLSLVEASQIIGMEEHPAQAVRHKKEASIVVATRLVREGAADAVVTMGHTGAAMIAALWVLGPIEGILRATIGTPYLGIQDQTFILDGGANVDCKPAHLLQFALMGSLYAEKMMGIKNPTIALLSNGAEEGKGDKAIIEAFPLLAKSGLNFIGNIEGMDIPRGRANVVVTDGLVGNVVVKLTEGLTSRLLTVIEEELASILPSQILDSTLRPTLAEIRKRYHYSRIGGMPLLGVNGVVVIGHGRSKAPAMVSAIGQAKKAVKSGLVESIRTGWQALSVETAPPRK